MNNQNAFIVPALYLCTTFFVLVSAYAYKSRMFIHTFNDYTTGVLWPY